MTKDKILIVYSSKTGNTRRVAEGIHEGLAARGMEARIAAVEENPRPEDDEIILLGFWVDRGNADKKALGYLASLEGRRVGLFGTLGAYPDSDHARDCAHIIEETVEAKNRCLGSFLCQGKIDPKLTEQFRQLPPDNPHAMNPERMKRHEEAAKHPDDADIAKAVEACAEMLARSEKEAP